MGIFDKDQEQIEYENLKDRHRDIKLEIRERLASNYRHLDHANSQSASKFEYLVEDNVDEAFLDEKGDRGWELVNFAPFTTGFGLGGNSRMTVQMRYIFKRKIADLPVEVAEEREAIAELRRERDKMASEIVARGGNPD